MMLTRKEIDGLDKLYRINLINSVTGIKPANLIGTKSVDGFENLAIISSVVHMGSNPPLLGFIMRPSGEVRRDTYENIKEQNLYTMNQVPRGLAENAHYTSAKFDREVSEFDRCNFTPEYLGDFPIPFVKESPIKIGLKLVEEIPIQANGTILIIGNIELLQVQDHAVNQVGQIDLEALHAVGISGLNTYYELKKKVEMPYARVNELPDWNDSKKQG